MKFSTAVIIVFLLALPCALLASSNENDLFRTIQAQKQLFARYYNSEDLDALTELYTEDATVIAPNFGPAKGHEAIRSGLAEELALGDGTIELQTLEVTPLSNQAAYEIGHYKIRIELDEGEPILDEGDYVVLWQLCDDGVWRLQVDTWNTSLPLE